MSRENRPWHPLEAAGLTWDEQGNPSSRDFEDIYYSSEDGIAESRHVFLFGNDLPDRWNTHPTPCFTIGETGFGSGLNFLLAWQAWRGITWPKPDLHFISIEAHPLARQDLEKALSCWDELADLSSELSAAYPTLLPGQHRLLFDGGRVRLDLWFEEALEALDGLAAYSPAVIDAWFLDGFAPARNPALWTGALCERIGALSRQGATFATFTAAGQVRRDLQAAGFDVRKTPGYGRKRERLVGTRTDVATHAANHASTQAATHQTPDTALTPWDKPQHTWTRPDRAIVLGAGLAGSTVANALASRGLEVTVIDRANIAGGASGNEQGVLYTRLSRKHSTLTDYALQSFVHATRFYRAMFTRGQLRSGLDGALCGNLQLATSSEDMQYLQSALAGSEDLAAVCDPHDASAHCGLEVPSGGYWLPGSGWLHPPAVCRSLLNHPNITCLEHQGDLALQQHGDGWRAVTGGQVLADAPCAVVAAGDASDGFAELSWLPLQKIRGQTTQLPADILPGKLQTTLCDEGYIAPARDGFHCIGASFVLRYNDLEPSAEENRDNLQRIAAMVPAWVKHLEALDPGSLQARVGVRCASPDYLPMAGAVPDYEAFLLDYAGLRKNARHTIDCHGSYVKGLFVSTAHGSRGLTYAPLAAQLVASQACGEVPPVSRPLARALSPARFIIRDLARNRI